MNPKKLVRKIVPKTAVKSLEKTYRGSRGLAWQARYGFPARGMRVIAVTGTNGKSTTCAYINEVLKAAGYKTAVLTTVFYEINGRVTPNRTHQTMDKQSILQAFFYSAKKADADWVILEVTSHSLDQARLMGVKIEIAVVTNLTQEHLDYHKTMDEYARVKSLLIRDYGAKWAVLNRDDKYYDYFADRAICRIFSVGKKPTAKARIGSIKLSSQKSIADLIFDKSKLKITTSLTGEFNLYNAAQAAAVGRILKLKNEAIEKGITCLGELNGRMQRVEAGQKFNVYVDFAITPDAIEQVLLSLKKITPGKIRIVFGATGDRDKQKRPKMGEVAARYADFIYLTDDETYTEDPEIIRRSVYDGIKKAGGTAKTTVIPDRKQAIAIALKASKQGDSVLLTGIGHEDSRNMGGRHIPWNEYEIALELLKNN